MLSVKRRKPQTLQNATTERRKRHWHAGSLVASCVLVAAALAMWRLTRSARNAKVKGDGDCLYHAVAAAGGGLRSGAALKARLADHVARNESLYAARYGSRLPQILERVRAPGAWGESEELEMLSDMLSKCIVVHTPCGPQAFHPGVGQVVHETFVPGALELVNMHNVHFDVA